MEPDDYVFQIKIAGHGRSGIPTNQQRIIFEANDLQNGKCIYCINETGIKKGSVASIMIRLDRGSTIDEKADTSEIRVENHIHWPNR